MLSIGSKDSKPHIINMFTKWKETTQINEDGKSKLRNRNSIKNMVIQELKRPFQVKTEKKMELLPIDQQYKKN